MKLKMCALATRLCREQGRRERTRYTMFGAKLPRDDNLFCVVIAFPDGVGYPVTARLMTEREKKNFRKRKQ